MIVRLLEQVQGLSEDSGLEVLSITDLVLSSLFAIVNISFVLIELIGEARAINLSPYTYAFMCLNGRIGFVPFVSSIQEQEFRQTMKTVPLDFESISGRALIFEFKLDFKFTNQTCMILSRAIQTLPIVQGSEEMPQIQFGNSLEEVEFTELYFIFTNCINRVKAIFQNIQLSKSDVEMIKGSIMYSFKKTPSQWNYGIIVESFIEGKFDPILQKIREKIDIPQLFSETMIDLQLQIDFDSVGKMFAQFEQIKILERFSNFIENIRFSRTQFNQQLQRLMNHYANKRMEFEQDLSLNSEQIEQEIQQLQKDFEYNFAQGQDENGDQDAQRGKEFIQFCINDIKRTSLPGKFGFSQAYYNVKSDKKNVEVNIVRTDGARGKLSCIIRTVELSDGAVEFEDYSRVYQRLDFQNQETEKTQMIPILSNYNTQEVMFMVMIEVNVDLKGPDLLDFSHKPIQFTQNECFVTISEPEDNQRSDKKHKKDKKKKDKKSKKRNDKKLVDGYGSEQ